jgi:hypothetical protein
MEASRFEEPEEERKASNIGHAKKLQQSPPILKQDYDRLQVIV